MNQPELPGDSSSESSIRPRRSRLARLLVIFGIVSTGTVLFCCVSMLLFHLDVTTKTAEVDAVARKFGPLKFPEDFKGVIAGSADNSLMWVQIARFEHKIGRGKLVIGGTHLRFREDAKADALAFEILLNELAPGIRLLDVRKKREKSIQIHGKSSNFEIVDGEDRASTTQYRQVTGTFPGPVGTANLLLQVEEGFISDQAIDELLDSLADTASTEQTPTINLNSK